MSASRFRATWWTRKSSAIARDYSRKARDSRLPSRQGAGAVIKQRFKEQILHDVAHDLIPRAVDEALRERGWKRWIRPTSAT